MSTGGVAGLALTCPPLSCAEHGPAHANNIAGSVRNLRRVVPGDAASSFLLIKLMTTSQNDPRYGAGMPLPGPGGLCPSAQDAIQAWITTGAQR